jgi:chromosome segregation ATPase
MGKVKDSQNLSAEMSSMDDCITHLREQEAKLKDKIKELEKTIEDHNDMVEAYDAVDCERLGAEEKIRELKEEIDEYDNQRLGAEEKIQEQHCEIDELKKKIKELEEDNEKLKNRVNGLEVDVGDWEMSDADKDDVIEELKEELRDTIKKVKDKEEENEKLKKDIKELEEDNEINVKTIKDHNATIHTWKMSCKLKDNEIEELRDTIKKASKTIEGNKEQLDVDGLRKLLKEAEGDFDYEEEDDWDYAYGSGWEINEDGYPEWTIVMAGGGDHWWNYVLRPNGLYKHNKNGYHKLKGQLISCPEGRYAYHKDFMDPTDNGSREGENDMAEMIDWEDAPDPSTC